MGAVVETRMGIKEERDEVVQNDRKGSRSIGSRGGLGGNGMRGVWVIGEGFFRGVEGVFNVSSHCQQLTMDHTILRLCLVQGA